MYCVFNLIFRKYFDDHWTCAATNFINVLILFLVMSLQLLEQEMRLRGFTQKTVKAYLWHVEHLLGCILIKIVFWIDYK